jgi:restriction enzyme bgcI alpha subunit
MKSKWTLENDVNDWVKEKLNSLNLKKHTDWNEETSMSDYLKEALKGSAKTKNKTNFGIPDFHIEKYNLPFIIEDKLNHSKLIAQNKDGVKFDDKSISQYAVNGALHYAFNMIASAKYTEVIAIGIAGDSQQNVEIKVYYVFGSAKNAYKELETVKELDFLENKASFQAFYKEAVLSEEEKHQILIESQATLQWYAKKLNKLMHSHNITAPQRVLYVSGMLLSMQDIEDLNGNKEYGLTPRRPTRLTNCHQKRRQKNRRPNKSLPRCTPNTRRKEKPNARLLWRNIQRRSTR